MPKPPDLPAGGDWPGFYTPYYTQVPDELFDYWLPRLSESELKVLLYIMRRTFGFKKHSDRVSMAQMVGGIVTHEGERLDWGTGLSEASVKGAIAKLLDKGLIARQYNQSKERGNLPPTYALRLRGTPDAPWVKIIAQEGSKSDPGVGVNSESSRGQNLTPQETVIQETVNKNGSEPRSGLIWQTAADHALELRLSNPLGVPGRACDLWRASGLSEAAFVARMQAAHARARRARLGERDRIYWQLVEE